jgi:hypothetical protein
MRASRRHLLALSVTLPAALSAVVLAGCAAVMGPPVVTLTQSDLDRLVQRHFPAERRLLEVFEVNMSTPRVRLLPERNRLAAMLEIQVRDRLLGGQWQGRLDVDAVLRWEPSDQTVRMTQVRVQDLAFASAAEPVRNAGTRLGALLAERVLEDMSLYRLPPDKAEELKRRGLAPAAVTVTSRGVEITFQPLPS